MESPSPVQDTFDDIYSDEQQHKSSYQTLEKFGATASSVKSWGEARGNHQRRQIRSSRGAGRRTTPAGIQFSPVAQIFYRYKCHGEASRRQVTKHHNVDPPDPLPRSVHSQSHVHLRNAELPRQSTDIFPGPTASQTLSVLPSAAPSNQLGSLLPIHRLASGGFPASPGQLVVFTPAPLNV